MAIKFRMDCIDKARRQWLCRKLFHSPGKNIQVLDKAAVTMGIERAAHS